MSLKDWIKKKGAIEVARLMNCDKAGVYKWGRGHCLPKSSQMYRIKRLTKGAVTYDSMIETFYAANPKKAAR